MQILLICNPIHMHFLPLHYLKKQNRKKNFSLPLLNIVYFNLISPSKLHHHRTPHNRRRCRRHHKRPMGRPPCCDKLNVKRGLWTPEEDAKLLAYVSDHGTGNWTLVPKKAGLNRCGKSCRLRWTNYLRPDLKHDSFLPEEEEHIINLHRIIGSRWSLIAKHLPGRTDNDVKNYWNTKLRKKLSKMGIDPVTHKPFSQIFSDFGNISRLPNAGNRFGRNIVHNNMSMSSLEASSILLNDDGFQSSKNVVMRPRTGLVQDSPSIYGNTAWNFFSQFQAPKDPNQDINRPHLFSEVNSSCSSPCSSTITQLSSPVQSQYSSSCQTPQAQSINPSSPFSWSEFLLCDPISSYEPDDDHLGMILSSTNSTLTQNEQNFNNIRSDQAMNTHAANASSSSGSSFVDAILCQDSEMSSQLFELLDASFD